MHDEAELDISAWSAEVDALLHELRTLSHGRADAAFSCALQTVDEALEAWHGRDRHVAVQERGLRAARAGERRARQRVCMALDLVTDLAAMPADPDEAQARDRAPAPDTRAAGPDPQGFEVLMLGGFELRFAGRRVTDWRGRRGPAVLQFLASRRGRFVDREILTEAVWPGLLPDLGRHRVHQAVYALRQTLHQLDPEPTHIVCENGAYRLDPRLPIRVDVEEFEQLVGTGAAHEAAGDGAAALGSYRLADQLYAGDLLENQPCADWALAERDRLRTQYVVLGGRLAELLAGGGDHRSALAVCLKVLDRDPCNEQVTRRAMRCYAGTDNRTLALQLYKSLAAELAADYDVAPSAETSALYEELLARM